MHTPPSSFKWDGVLVPTRRERELQQDDTQCNEHKHRATIAQDDEAGLHEMTQGLETHLRRAPGMFSFFLCFLSFLLTTVYRYYAYEPQ